MDNPAYEPAPEDVWVVKVTTWHRLPKEQIGDDLTQKDVADWMVDEYLGPCGFTADWEPVYTKLVVHDKDNSILDYQLCPAHWRAAQRDGSESR